MELEDKNTLPDDKKEKNNKFYDQITEIKTGKIFNSRNLSRPTAVG